MTVRYFVEVLFEGDWNRAGVAATYAEAETLEQEIADETFRETRIVSKKSSRQLGRIEFDKAGSS